MRALLGISAISVAMTAAVVSNAYYQKMQFYPSVVYITKSKPSMAVRKIRMKKGLKNLYLISYLCSLLSGDLHSIVGVGSDVGETDAKGMCLWV